MEIMICPLQRVEREGGFKEHEVQKMASVLLAASLLIGCAAAENRTIFKRMSEEESMANEALPVEERAESFSPAGLLSLKDRAAILVQDDTSRLYSLYTWQPGQQE